MRETGISLLRNRLVDGLLSVIFPARCALCGEPVESLADGIVCAACWSDLEHRPRDPRCRRCHMPVSAREAPAQCPACSEMVLDLLRYVGPYRGALREHLLFLKRKPQVCERLRERIREVLREDPVFRDVEVVLPVPLHPRRLRERGYNQATLLARDVARVLARPLREDVLRRIVDTEPRRAGMDARERAQSIAGSFAVTSEEAVRGKILLLVDDVYTSGATLNECARTLRQAGARRVFGFVIARAAE